MAEASTRFSEAEQHSDLKKQSQSRPSAGSSKSEYLNPKQVEKEANLKKQSQFAVDDIAASLCAEDGYGDISAGETGENKAKRTQFQAPRPPSQAGALLNH